MAIETKYVKTPKDMPQLCSRVGVLHADRTYELPADIADDIIKTRGAELLKPKAPTSRKATKEPKG